MKKLLLAVLLLFALFWVATLVFIPNPLTVSVVVPVRVSAAKAGSLVLDSSHWPTWWPQQRNEPYRVVQLTSIGVQLLSGTGPDTMTSEIIVLPAAPDSALVQWKTERAAAINPFTRLQQYRQASHTQQQFQQVLDSLAAYTSSRQRMYGMDIAVTQFKNPFMLTSIKMFSKYPSVNEVYTVVDQLRSHARANEAVAVDSPMINIEKTDSTFLLRTALPISKQLSPSRQIGFKQMVLGNTLLATVSGGQQTVTHSIEQMKLFIDDHRLSSPAIPFAVWQTNRQQQPDSSQWVTRLYYPIF